MVRENTEAVLASNIFSAGQFQLICKVGLVAKRELVSIILL